MIAAKIAKETIHIIIDEPTKKFTNAKTPAPINNPIPSMSKGERLPLVNTAISVMSRNIPAVIPKAIPNNQ